MGFYATTAECTCREKMHAPPAKPSGEDGPPSENRVWGFSATFRNRAWKSESQVFEPQQENRPTPTATASGVLFYGYRYYKPELGRWVNRDPIGERGGLNVHGFVRNNPVWKVDWLGMAYSSYHTFSKGKMSVDISGSGGGVNRKITITWVAKPVYRCKCYAYDFEQRIRYRNLEGTETSARSINDDAIPWSITADAWQGDPWDGARYLTVGGAGTYGLDADGGWWWSRMSDRPGRWNVHSGNAIDDNWLFFKQDDGTGIRRKVAMDFKTIALCIDGGDWDGDELAGVSWMLDYNGSGSAVEISGVSYFEP